jgi:hypothetical protein
MHGVPGRKGSGRLTGHRYERPMKQLREERERKAVPIGCLAKPPSPKSRGFNLRSSHI